uniref:Uncharacterized protein n=1 Tax=Rhizophora mucronata TaxID=61149 RepID=A0A2P2PVJ6_RHIMU
MYPEYMDRMNDKVDSYCIQSILISVRGRPRTVNRMCS